MKKEDVSGIIVYLLIMALAILFGLNVLRNHAANSGMDGGTYFGFIVGAIATGLIFNAILFELAHKLGAKIGRYTVISTNVLGLLWYRENGKLHVKLSSFDGLTGETKILPKENAKKEPNPTPYLWFGTLFYALEIILVVFTFSFLNNTNLEIAQGWKNFSYFLLVVAVIGGMILLYNILPLHLDSTTDGYRLTMVTNAANKKAFNELLRVEYQVSQGATDIEVATFTDMTNFTADLNLNKVYLLLDKHEYGEAERLLDIILAGKATISPKVYVRARAQKIYINIVSKPLEEAKEFYDKEVSMQERREISNDPSMTSARTYLLMSGLLDKSQSESEIACRTGHKSLPRTPKRRQNTEIALFNEAIDLVNKAHPKWELDKYKLEPIPEKPQKKAK
ncbi:MAG: hypothetical protein K6F07_02770 [Bacilli bacterium]|nr:hypothetical protein [Bacilli bacterium]